MRSRSSRSLVRELEVHDVEPCARARRRGPPGLPSILAVVHRIDDDIVSEAEVLFGYRASRFVRSDPDLSASR
ncbi:hypothetical protein GCM10009592_18870 [Brachybacterium rhamnosum]|nr:hypothetical protein C1N80_07510 [Brachybacterium sp. SGAir0954]